MSTRSRLASVMLASASLSWMTPAALAQDSAPDAPAAAAAETGNGDETVVVTARRRSETLFETPATVTALSGATLRKAGADDIRSIMQLVPNATVPTDPQGFNTYINIRGIRQVDPQAEPNFGVYRNGIYAGGQRTNMGGQVDVERFEVLRGPQGGLYGRDAVGGAINIVYAMPKDEFGGYGSLTFANHERVEFQGAVNSPLSDNFAIRVAGWYFKQKAGEFYNITRGEEVDRSEDKGARLSARWDVNDAWSVTWVAEYQETEGPAGRTYAPNGVNSFGNLTPKETPRTIRRDASLRAETKQVYLSQNIQYETGSAGTFNLLAAYRNYDLLSQEDQDYTAIPISSAPFAIRQDLNRDESIENAYVELVWTSPQDQPFTWVAGASYFNEKFEFARIIETSLDFSRISFLGFPPIGPQTAWGALPGQGTTIKTEAYSIFADFDYALTDRFSLTASLRYSSDKKKLDYSQYVYGNPATLPLFLILFANVIVPFDLKTAPTFDHFSPSVGFHYKVSDNINVYGLISDGFRAGGFNTTSTAPELIPFNSEQATNYELGVKTQWYGGDLGVNLAVFYMEQSDLLVRRNDPISPPAFNFTYLQNAGDAETWGAELEVYARLASWLTGAATVGWLDAEYVKGEAFGVSLVGQNIPYTRDWTLNFRLDADIPVDADWAVVGTVNYRFETGGSLDDFGTAPYEDLNKLDASLGLAYQNTRFVAYVDNAFDDKLVDFEFAVGAVTQTPGRTYGIRISTDF